MNGLIYLSIHLPDHLGGNDVEVLSDDLDHQVLEEWVDPHLCKNVAIVLFRDGQVREPPHETSVGTVGSGSYKSFCGHDDERPTTAATRP